MIHARGDSYIHEHSQFLKLLSNTFKCFMVIVTLPIDKGSHVTHCLLLLLLLAINLLFAWFSVRSSEGI
jgi:hypothetical protein